MKLNIFKMIDSTMQKMMLGGLVGSLSYWADLAIADTQAAYPAQLKARIAPQLPRNDELLTSIAPPAIMYMLSKKKAKVKEMAKGTLLYSAPHLMQRIVVNATAPSASAAFAMNGPTRVFATVTQTNNRIYPPRTPVAPTVVSTSVGKYR